MVSARLTIDPRLAVGPLDRRLFGSFVEHLGRCVYDGIYEPGHRNADEDGFRTDVLDLVRELGVTTVRYPGGNFVSGFRWEDSVGPRPRRPRRLDLAWHSTETNEVGLHEFSRWLDKAGADLMLAVNLGTRGTLEALDLLEYCNIGSRSRLSDLRAEHGTKEAFNVRMWCLGNEMDGPWQLGHRSAEDYGKLASRTAKAMRQLDEKLQLVVCGSSNASMPTFGQDEWNVWYLSRFQNVERITGIDTWPVAPRLLEDVYSVADAVVVGSLLMSLLRHADRVHAANLAQLANVIAPIVTEPGGAAWRQTTFHPFAVTSRLARGTSLRVPLDTDTYPTPLYGPVAVVDAAAT